MIINRIFTKQATIFLSALTRPHPIPALRSYCPQPIGAIFAGRKLAFGYRSEQEYIDFTKDYYQILGIDQQATFQEIKTQFYLLAKEHHPDKEKGDEAFFKEINEAYNVLSQPKLKSEYDANRVTVQDETNASPQQRPLSYQPYSQMSKAEWNYVRRGTVKHDRTDYSNYQKKETPEFDLELTFKEKQQWKRAFKSITPQQLKQEHQFREKIVKKYKEDVMIRRREKQEFLDKKLEAAAAKVQKYLGRGARHLFEKMISK